MRANFLGVLISSFPVKIPLIAVIKRADDSHAVHSVSSPLCPGLFESGPDQVFTGPLHLPASNR